MHMVPARPRWLDDEPEIVALLHSVVDRFGQRPGEERTHPIHVQAERSLKPLKRLDDSADQCWLFIQDLQRIGVLEIKPGKHSPLDAPWLNARLAFPLEAETILRAWLNRPALPSELNSWRELVTQHAGSFPGGVDALMRRRLVIPGHTDHEIIAALAGIAHFPHPVTLRQLSASLFRGDSKLLDDRAELLQALFPELKIRQRAIVVAIHLPAHIEGILFIENQESYVSACDGALPNVEHLALVYAAGFRGSAERIREQGGALLHFCGTGIPQWREQLESWWSNQREWQPPLYFFGDLDFSGMGILVALRRRFGDVMAWQPGYNRLLEHLAEQRGHSPHEADKELQCDPGTTGCNYADTVLLPAMRQHGFLDQEGL